MPVMAAAPGTTRKKGSLGEPTSVPMLLCRLSAIICSHMGGRVGRQAERVRGGCCGDSSNSVAVTCPHHDMTRSIS